MTVGYTPAGKRIMRRVSGRTKTEAMKKLKQLLRDVEDGTVVAESGFTVAQAVEDWLTYGLNGRAATTVATRRILADKHVIPALGARKLRDLSAEDVDRWLAEKSTTLSTRTLRDIRSILRRAIDRAQARDKVKRNVVLLSEVPVGQEGRPSKALTFEQAEALLNATPGSTAGAYIVLSLLTGARTEELRELTWSHVVLASDPGASVVPHVMVWRSVRVGGDTKTKKSRRTLALPARCVEALKAQKFRQEAARRLAGARWIEHDLVFASEVGTALDAANVRRAFRKVAALAGLRAADWTPRELRHSFVSLLSDDGMPIEQISRLVGHSGTTVTELVYRKQIRPVVEDGATAMDRIFPEQGA
ncbi:site-specific integrase [Pseudonocardia sp. EV170527-09]|uniref:tyrosine-type recombinase/integrase n=1 Tax=Pseudonocardia sp. EV170527-09 TaxID=2603411 RepID=UPI001EFF815D|nr:site-specific integrase [Pseudonocardia sp. EV170527-09]